MKTKRHLDLHDADRVTNTARHARMEDALLGGNPKAIVAQEAAGQAQLARASQLPAQGLTVLSASNRATFSDPVTGQPCASPVARLLTAAGGKVHGPSPGDDLFVDVTLPPGWAVVPTDHHMWSELRDEKGRKRAGIFYKAAFYDRGAHVHADLRLTVGSEADYDAETNTHTPVIKAGGVVLWRGKTIEDDYKRAEMSAYYSALHKRGVPTFGEGAYVEASDRARRVAATVAARVVPLHDKVDAYWDLTDEQLRALMPAWESLEPQGVAYRYAVTKLVRRADERPQLDDEGGSYHFDEGRGFYECDILGRRRPRTFNRKTESSRPTVLVCDWASENWKTKVHTDDARAIAWWRANWQRLMGCDTADVRIFRGDVEVHKERSGLQS